MLESASRAQSTRISALEHDLSLAQEQGASQSTKLADSEKRCHELEARNAELEEENAALRAQLDSTRSTLEHTRADEARLLWKLRTYRIRTGRLEKLVESFGMRDHKGRGKGRE